MKNIVKLALGVVLATGIVQANAVTIQPTYITNLVQTVNIHLTAYAQGPRTASESDISAGTFRTIDLIKAINTNYSSKAQLVFIVTNTAVPGLFYVRDLVNKTNQDTQVGNFNKGLAGPPAEKSKTLNNKTSGTRYQYVNVSFGSGPAGFEPMGFGLMGFDTLTLPSLAETATVTGLGGIGSSSFLFTGKVTFSPQRKEVKAQ